MESKYIAILLPIIGAGIGYYFKHLIEKRRELLSEVTKERRELYQKFINLVVDILESVKKGEKNEVNFLSELYGFYKKYILYASPQVINRFADYIQFLYVQNMTSENKNLKLQFRKLTAIMTAMRKDLGLKNNKLGKDGINILRALITDFDETMK